MKGMRTLVLLSSAAGTSPATPTSPSTRRLQHPLDPGQEHSPAKCSMCGSTRMVDQNKIGSGAAGEAHFLHRAAIVTPASARPSKLPSYDASSRGGCATASITDFAEPVELYQDLLIKTGTPNHAFR